MIKRVRPGFFNEKGVVLATRFPVCPEVGDGASVAGSQTNRSGHVTSRSGMVSAVRLLITRCGWCSAHNRAPTQQFRDAPNIHRLGERAEMMKTLCHPCLSVSIRGSTAGYRIPARKKVRASSPRLLQKFGGQEKGPAVKRTRELREDEIPRSYLNFPSCFMVSSRQYLM